MSALHAPSLPALKVLQSLSNALSVGELPLKWWDAEISALPAEIRRPLLSELAVILAHDMKGINHFAQGLIVEKSDRPAEYDSILCDFLLPLHEAVVQAGVWEEALNLEIVIYSLFIKQDENHDIYERAFAGLYAPYSGVLAQSVDKSDAYPIAASDQIAPPEGACLFWFQNYSVLAHTELVLDLARHLPGDTKLYASALTNINLERSQATFTHAGIDILRIDDRQSLTARCQELIRLCKSHGITNIVMVSLPLQSGYLKRICKGVSLTWWSMKFPLGCMPHFDRLVSSRSLYPTQKEIFGAIWHYAPFAVKALPPHLAPTPLPCNAADLNVGVLAREEKFASSPLPETLHRSLYEIPGLRLFWTGRREVPDLTKRLHGDPGTGVNQRVHFVGWVDPAMFLTQVDLLVDTPNLGGLAAYWAMSMGKVVISATDTGSVGALGSRQDLQTHFQLLSSAEEVRAYFTEASTRPYYLLDVSLTKHCLAGYAADRALLAVHGQRFLRFFNETLSDMGRWSRITYQMLQGENPL